MNGCPECRAREVEQERLEAERKEARDAANKNRGMMKKWRKYIQGLPPYQRFSF